MSTDRKAIHALKKIGFQTYNFTRGLTYLAQSRFLNEMTALLRLREKNEVEKNPELINAARKALFDLLIKDSERFSDGTYPLACLDAFDFISSLPRFPALFADALKVLDRRKAKDWKISEKNVQQGPEYPKYFQRMFHFQTDGYLSKESAERYEHQVEVLFAGGANAMRRMAIPHLVSRYQENSKIKVLEIACGTGIGSELFLKACPDASVTLSDLSPHYLQLAKENTKRFLNTNVIQADATALPFQNESYDEILCIYLHHELPESEREKTFQEAFRVLRTGGHFIVIDSVQKGEVPDLDPLLEQFPKDYHEPFFKNYTLKPLARFAEAQGFKLIHQETGFLSKLGIFAK